MARQKGSKNKKLATIYPRKCNYCDYVSNNPSMWYYHNQTHLPIPADARCDYGCGQLARYRGTGGKLTCEKTGHHCPAYICRHSKLIKEQWDREESRARRDQTRNKFLLNCVHNKAIREKNIASIRSRVKNFTPEQAKDYEQYGRKVRRLSRRYVDAMIADIDYSIYQIDHIMSVFDCWFQNLPVEHAAHIINCRVVHKSINASKGKKSLMTKEELLSKIALFEQTGVCQDNIFHK